MNFGSGGVSLETSGFQNANTAFYTFTGAQLQNIFNVSQGQINFNLTSSYNLAARLLLPQYSYRDVFDGFDNSQELFLFQVQAEQGRLIFCYNTGGTSTQSYWVPAGTENTLFGQGVTLQVKLAWSGSSLNLYLNGTLVNTTSYTQATPNWTSTSSFTLGANDPHYYGGGYFSCDDVIGGFQAQNLASSTPALHGDVERGGAIGRVHGGIGLEQHAADGSGLSGGGRGRHHGGLDGHGGEHRFQSERQLDSHAQRDIAIGFDRADGAAGNGVDAEMRREQPGV